MVRCSRRLRYFFAGLALFPGCATLSGRQKIEQLEAETERVLSDYRSQRERADRLDLQNRALVERLMHMEGAVAATDSPPSHKQPAAVAAAAKHNDDAWNARR